MKQSLAVCPGHSISKLQLWVQQAEFFGLVLSLLLSACNTALSVACREGAGDAESFNS